MVEKAQLTVNCTGGFVSKETVIRSCVGGEWILGFINRVDIGN